MFSLVTFATFNAYSNGVFFEQRKDAIVDEIVKLNADVICLQEAIPELIELVDKALNGDTQESETDTDKMPTAHGGNKYGVWTKYDAVTDQDIFPEQYCASGMKIMLNYGYMCIFSRYPIIEKDLVFKGSYFDEGIMRARVDISDSVGKGGVLVDVYCVHFKGGSFGGDEERKQYLEDSRRYEAALLVDDVRKQLGFDSNVDADRICSDYAVILGDFNSDGNNPRTYPEIAMYPDKALGENAIDCWEIHKWHKSEDVRIGATESHKHNHFRDFLKPGQNREARFDRIMVCSSRKLDANKICSSVNLFGNKELVRPLDKESADKVCTRKRNMPPLFLSDHFGVVAKIVLHKYRS